LANVSNTLHINFYQNRSTFAEVMHKSILRVFMTNSVEYFVQGHTSHVEIKYTRESLLSDH